MRMIRSRGFGLMVALNLLLAGMGTIAFTPANASGTDEVGEACCRTNTEDEGYCCKSCICWFQEECTSNEACPDKET